MNRFFTESGVEVPALTTEQMREVDRIAIEETGPNLYQMMENAGRNLATLAILLLGKGWQKAKVVVLAGSGGNGGGGVCAARHLANRNVKVYLCLANSERLSEVPAFQRKVFQFTCGEEVDISDLRYQHVDLVLDALIGYGLQSAPRGTVQKLMQWARESDAPILSLDVPSGLDSTTGETHGDYIQATWTMTLALPKTGLLSDKIGKLYLADIGIPEETFRRVNPNYSSPFNGDFIVELKRSG